MRRWVRRAHTTCHLRSPERARGAEFCPGAIAGKTSELRLRYEESTVKVLLVNPPSGTLTMGLKQLSKVEPLALEILGAAIPEHDVEILDMELDTNVGRALRRFQPDVVGVSAQIVQTYSAQRVLREAKAFNPATLTLLGGHHATLRPDEFNAPYIDAIVLGEGVPAFQEILARRAGGANDFSDIPGLALPQGGAMHYTPPRPMPTTLDHQPLPSRSLTAKYRSRYFYLFESSVASIQTSMGCSFGCTFCSCQAFSRRHFIPRSPERIVEDLAQIDEEFVILCDDHSFLDPARMERLHDLIVERGIHKRYFACTRTDCVVADPELFAQWAGIGLMLVMTGLEALGDTGIDAVHKGTSAGINERAIAILSGCGIALSAGFLVSPDFTEADFQRIDDYVRARPNIVLTELTPLPGTELYAQMAGQTLTDNRELYDLAHFVIPTALPPPEMYRLIRKYYRRIVWRAIRRLKLYRPRQLLNQRTPRLAHHAVLSVDRMMRQAPRHVSASPPADH